MYSFVCRLSQTPPLEISFFQKCIEMELEQVSENETPKLLQKMLSFSVFFLLLLFVLIFFNYCHIESPAEENCSASPLFVSSLMSFNLTFMCQSVPLLILTTR